MVSVLVLPFVLSGVLAAAGCGKTSPFTVGGLSDNQTISVTSGDQKNSASRRYRVFLPDSYDNNRPTPVILSYHGANQHIEDQVTLDRLTAPFFNKDHIVVYLQGNAVRPYLTFGTQSSVF
jgi:poly(3-hydroxybutyrate) depolymerase